MSISRGDYTVGDVGVPIYYDTDIDMTDIDIDFEFIKPSGNVIVRDSSSISTTRATYNFASGDLDEAGTWHCRLKEEDAGYYFVPEDEVFEVAPKPSDQGVP
jgi:hypothetical protein